MFLRCKVRRKDGKQHRYWSVVENTRVAGGRVVQRHVLHLGEIRDRTYENQQHRASGLNLLVTAIILWNTRYLGESWYSTTIARWLKSSPGRQPQPNAFTLQICGYRGADQIA